MRETQEVPPNFYRINDLIVDTGARRVSRGNETLKVVGLTFDMLLALIEHAPALASYEQLADSVWKGRSVSPETIAQRAKMLRDALSEDAKSPRYFELIRGQGYRLIADLEPTDELPATRPSRRWPAVALLVAAVGVLLVWFITTIRDDDIPASVAVLPFADMSAKGDQQYLADGLAEELINQLAGLDGLEVASRSESFYYQQPVSDMQAIGNQLGVAAIVEGSVRRLDNDLRVSVQLIDVASGYHLWSDTFDRELEDLFAIQEGIATAVAGALGVKLGVGGVNEFPGAGTDSIEAYEAFLQHDYERAIVLDPTYAAAWARRGLSIASTMHENPPEDAPEIIGRALQSVDKAIELDSDSAAAHANYATLIYVTMNWPEAERAYARSLALRRSHETLAHYANMMMRVGRSRLAEEIHQQREAMLRVDVDNNALRANVYIALGEFDAARKLAAELPAYYRSLLSLFIAVSERSDRDVRSAMAEMLPNSPDYQLLFRPLLELMDSPDEALMMMQALADDPNRMWPFKYHNIAIMAAYLGHAEFAFDVFSRELRYTPIRFGALWYPVMADSRRLPAFKQFAIDANLVSYWRKYGWSDFCRPSGPDDFVCE